MWYFPELVQYRFRTMNTTHGDGDVKAHPARLFALLQACSLDHESTSRRILAVATVRPSTSMTKRGVAFTTPWSQPGYTVMG